jgi:mono/diheme cytochrome c family protein
VIPDLRYSQVQTFERYADIVLGGALASAGMPSFKETLSDADVAAIRAYVLSRRAQVAK